MLFILISLLKKLFKTSPILILLSTIYLLLSFIYLILLFYSYLSLSYNYNYFLTTNLPI